MAHAADGAGEAVADHAADTWANPAIIGLMGFATTTMATGLHHVGFWGAGPTLAMALAFGGTAQFVAGIIAMRKGELFLGSAFTSYGAFWWAVFALLFVIPGSGVTVTAMQEAGFFLMWTLFTAMFAVAVVPHGRYLTALFWLLLVAFALLTLYTYGVSSGTFAPGGTVQVAMGWEILVVGLLAWYIAGAELINAEFDREVLPLS
ncbi:MAG: acetate uptake transporter [Halanaeroarchaeum sp.]